jgi:hypothetical protein
LLNEKFTESDSEALLRSAARTFTIRIPSVFATLAFYPGYLRQVVVVVGDTDDF